MASELKNLSIYTETGIAKQNPQNPYRIGIAVSEWNQEITSNLASGAIETLKKYGYSDDDIVLRSVPGSFELPLGAIYLIENQNCDAVICLGCVIQGDTKHFDYVCSGVTQGIMDVNTRYATPVAFGLLTTNNQQQALDRAGGRLGNKGTEAAAAALKMLTLKNEVR